MTFRGLRSATAWLPTAHSPLSQALAVLSLLGALGLLIHFIVTVLGPVIIIIITITVVHVIA